MIDGTDPLILTLGFDDVSFAVFDGLRRAHFPAHRNLIPAHLTLFHQLPGGRLSEVVEAVERETTATGAFHLEVDGLRKLGGGVAFNLSSPELTALRARLALKFPDDLTAQDRKGYRPHVTIQNKVPPVEADALFDEMSSRRCFSGTTAGDPGRLPIASHSWGDQARGVNFRITPEKVISVRVPVVIWPRTKISDPPARMTSPVHSTKSPT